MTPDAVPALAQRLSVAEQVARGCLVCPITHRRLVFAPDRLTLITKDGERAYRVLSSGVPLALADEAAARAYAHSSERMSSEYASRPPSRWKAMRKLLRNDYRTAASQAAFERLFEGLPKDALVVSPGGGPLRPHPQVVNVNIGPFESVDVVGDAHCLPYADECVDAVHSEAVFEHLAEPRIAAQELFRVLKRGGRGYVCTPFLQQYHGYPRHYQNYTLQGHRYLFESCGFKVLEAGHAVGPVVALTTLIAAALKAYLPRPLNWIAWGLWTATALLMRPLDQLLERHPAAAALASTTYLLIERPVDREAT